MGVGAKIAGAGIAVVAIGGLAYAAIRFLPGFIAGSSLGLGFGLADLIPKFENPLLPNIRQEGITPTFSDIELLAAQFKESIGRPGILRGEITPLPGGGTRITQTGAAPRGRFFFGSDFTSAERLADLASRFMGRDRSARIQELINERGSRQSVNQVSQAANLINQNRAQANATRFPSGSAASLRNIQRTAIAFPKGALIGPNRQIIGFSSKASGKTRSFFSRRSQSSTRFGRR